MKKLGGGRYKCIKEAVRDASARTENTIGDERERDGHIET